MRTYVVWCPDLGQDQEDGATIPATDPADAAEGWAEWHDRSSAEYRISSGREEIVIVRDVETGEQREWSKLTPNKCKWCGHDIHAHDKQYGCAEDGCDCETPNARANLTDTAR